MQRPFEGLADEPEWVALREVVPAATAPLTLTGEHADREVTLCTLLPLAWPALVRADGHILLGLQTRSASDDISRDLAAALELALTTDFGNPVRPVGLPGPGARLQDLLAAEPLVVTVHTGFDFWVDQQTLDSDANVAASMAQANEAAVPTERLTEVQAAYWCRLADRTHLRWALPEPEDDLLDAFARLQVDRGLELEGVGKYLGSFRAHGLLVPVWDLIDGAGAESCEEPAAALRARLDEALAETGPLPPQARRLRGAILGRQLTLR